MDSLIAVEVLALLSTGLKAGVLFGDRIGVRFARSELSPSSFVKFQQVQLLHWEKVMPALAGVSALSCIAWLALIWSRMGTVSFILVLLATLAHLASMVLAIAGCLPINKQLMTWSVASPPPDVMTTWIRWEQIINVRTFLAVIAFLCLLLAAVASNGAAA